MQDHDLDDGKPETLPPGATRKLVGLGAVSLLWIIGGLAYGWHLGPPTAANEWGDLIAGVFAPAAFLWLIGAVWIQSDELREQRKELILTRKEFAYNREVMQAQAEEARKQAELVGEQTEILKSQRLAQQRDDYLREFDELIIGIETFLSHGVVQFGLLKSKGRVNFQSPRTVSNSEDAVSAIIFSVEAWQSSATAKRNSYSLNPDKRLLILAATKMTGRAIALEELLMGRRSPQAMRARLHALNEALSWLLSLEDADQSQLRVNAKAD